MGCVKFHKINESDKEVDGNSDKIKMTKNEVQIVETPTNNQKQKITQ